MNMTTNIETGDFIGTDNYVSGDGDYSCDSIGTDQMIGFIGLIWFVRN